LAVLCFPLKGLLAFIRYGYVVVSRITKDMKVEVRPFIGAGLRLGQMN
jgi:hypothetical protein